MLKVLFVAMGFILLCLPDPVMGQGISGDEEEYLQFLEDFYLSPEAKYNVGSDGFFSYVETFLDTEKMREKFNQRSAVKKAIAEGEEAVAEILRRTLPSAEAQYRKDFPDLPKNIEDQLLANLAKLSKKTEGGVQESLSSSRAQILALEEILTVYRAAIDEKVATAEKQGRVVAPQQVVHEDVGFRKLLNRKTQKILLTQGSDKKVPKLSRVQWRQWKENQMYELRKNEARLVEKLFENEKKIFPISNKYAELLDKDGGVPLSGEERVKLPNLNLNLTIHVNDFDCARIQVLKPSEIPAPKADKFFPGTIYHLKNGERWVLSDLETPRKHSVVAPRYSNLHFDLFGDSQHPNFALEEWNRESLIRFNLMKIKAMKAQLEKTMWRPEGKFLSSLEKKIQKQSAQKALPYLRQQVLKSVSASEDLQRIIFRGFSLGGWDYWKDRGTGKGLLDPVKTVIRLRKKMGLDVSTYENAFLYREPIQSPQIGVNSKEDPWNKQISMKEVIFEVNESGEGKFFEFMETEKLPKLETVDVKPSHSGSPVVELTSAEGKGAWHQTTRSKYLEPWKGRYILLPTPLDHELTGIKLRTPSGRVLVRGKDYILKKDIHGNAMLAELLESEGEPISIEASFQKSALPDVNPSEIVFSTKRLAKISPELRRAKLDLLADRLEKLAQEKQSIDGKALEDEFRGIGDYSRKKAPNRLQGEGRYSLFSKFVGKNGKLCYQCDGANALLGMIFQDYYRGESGVKVRRIGGVVAINNQLNRGGGHANLALKIGNSRTVFDTTPPTGDESGALTNFRRMLPDLLQLENEGARSEEFKLTPLNAVLKDGSKDGLDGILTKESSIKNMEALRGDFLKFLKSEKYPIHRKHHQWLHPFRILGLYHRFFNGRAIARRIF